MPGKGKKGGGLKNKYSSKKSKKMGRYGKKK